jgi:hypothetical protein
MSEEIYDLADKMVTSAGNLVTSFCYDYATASGFTRVFDSVLTSVTVNNLHSANIAKVYYALDKKTRCQFEGIICGQMPFTYSGNSIDEIVGIVGATLTQEYFSSFSDEFSEICTRLNLFAENWHEFHSWIQILPRRLLSGIDRSKIGSLSLVNAVTSSPSRAQNYRGSLKLDHPLANRLDPVHMS